MPDADRGKYHPGNTLNDLTGKEWLTATRTWFAEAAAADLPPEIADALQRFAAELAAPEAAELSGLTPDERLEFASSWFIADSKRYHQNRDTELHPARYPEEMVERFVRFFTKQGMWVLDPFLGSGATLITCRETGRHGVGCEVNPKYAQTARGRLMTLAETAAVVLRGDVRQATEATFWQPAIEAGCPVVDGLPQFDLIMTSPPYWNMLRQSRGNVQSAHKDRAAKGLDTHYGERDDDLGNVPDYDDFIEALGGVFDGLYPRLKPGRYLVIVIQNLRAPGGEIKPLAWDLARRVGQTYRFQGEQLWCQNTKKLGIWGYPKIFVPNYHHHYCLIFRRPASE